MQYTTFHGQAEMLRILQNPQEFIGVPHVDFIPIKCTCQQFERCQYHVKVDQFINFIDGKPICTRSPADPIARAFLKRFACSVFIELTPVQSVYIVDEYSCENVLFFEIINDIVARNHLFENDEMRTHFFAQSINNKFIGRYLSEKLIMDLDGMIGQFISLLYMEDENFHRHYFCEYFAKLLRVGLRPEQSWVKAFFWFTFLTF